MSADKVVFTRPDYWDEACRYLGKKDRVMKRLIPQFGEACLQSRGDAFTTLARSIVGQQISVKAAQTVWDRFAKLPRKMTAGNVLKLKPLATTGYSSDAGRMPYFSSFTTRCLKTVSVVRLLAARKARFPPSLR